MNIWIILFAIKVREEGDRNIGVYIVSEVCIVEEGILEKLLVGLVVYRKYYIFYRSVVLDY